ncbi:MAG: DNA-binding response regulator [Halobacteriovoraceae bacterium]|nr:DNA-binding response regulator [Halobacteriovoraceae bacterium]|tara:strand:- start:192976 stop:193668 length:693 start_codon:yes stop_codon:yes gene_type:complete
MDKSILLVEDSKEIYQIVNQALSRVADIKWGKSLQEGRDLIKENSIDLLLLDLELPDGNGIELCEELQSTHPELPIFLLTAHDQLSDKVLGFSAGADDYITKPFNSLELKARIEAKLRKLDILMKSSDILEWNELSINKSSQTLKVISDGDWENVELTALEFKLLMYFAVNEGKVLNREDILDEIWGQDVHVYSRSVDTHVSKLRKKLLGASETIESVHGVGYKFCPTSN